MMSETQDFRVSSLNCESSTNIAHYIIKDVILYIFIQEIFELFVSGTYMSLPFPLHYNGFMAGEVVDR